MADALAAITAYLAQEKVRAEERIRVCQAFLLDPEVDEASARAAASHIDIKGDLERMRQNAEDDYGTVLHLLTVLRARAENLVPVGNGAAAGDAGSFKVEQANSRSGAQKSDIDPLANAFEDDLDPLMNDALFDASGARGRAAAKSPAMDDLDEEDDDIELDRRGLAGEDEPVVSGRFIGVRASQNSMRSAQNLARSLPISVPLPERPGFDLAALPELEHDDEPGQVDIASSIQMIAKSLHTNALGELPPSRMKRFNAD